MRLVPCPSCQRHVRDDSGRCPFCEGALSSVGVAPPERIARLGRAAIMAFGVAATAASGQACHKDDNIAQPYGAPPNPTPTPTVTTAAPPGSTADAAPTASSAASTDGAMVQLYGAPPLPPVVDAGATKDAGSAKDAGAPKKDAGTAAAVTATASPTVDIRNLKKPYGAPPIPDDYV